MAKAAPHTCHESNSADLKQREETRGNGQIRSLTGVVSRDIGGSSRWRRHDASESDDRHLLEQVPNRTDYGQPVADEGARLWRHWRRDPIPTSPHRQLEPQIRLRRSTRHRNQPDRENLVPAKQDEQ